MNQWLYWVGSRVAACMCCVSVGFSQTDRNELWQLPCVSPSGATSVPVYAPCVTMWWRDCSCGVRAAATADIWSTWWTGSKAALTALPAAVTCASTPELLTTTVNRAGPLWEWGNTHTHSQTICLYPSTWTWSVCSPGKRRTALKWAQTRRNQRFTCVSWTATQEQIQSHVRKWCLILFVWAKVYIDVCCFLQFLTLNTVQEELFARLRT